MKNLRGRDEGRAYQGRDQEEQVRLDIHFHLKLIKKQQADEIAEAMKNLEGSRLPRP